MNSTWYPEIEEPIKSREKHYSLVLYILNIYNPTAGVKVNFSISFPAGSTGSTQISWQFLQNPKKAWKRTWPWFLRIGRCVWRQDEQSALSDDWVCFIRWSQRVLHGVKQGLRSMIFAWMSISLTSTQLTEQHGLIKEAIHTPTISELFVGLYRNHSKKRNECNCLYCFYFYCFYCFFRLWRKTSSQVKSIVCIGDSTSSVTGKKNTLKVSKLCFLQPN